MGTFLGGVWRVTVQWVSVRGNSQYFFLSWSPQYVHINILERTQKTVRLKIIMEQPCSRRMQRLV